MVHVEPSAYSRTHIYKLHSVGIGRKTFFTRALRYELEEKFEDTKGVSRRRKSKIPKGQSEDVNLRYQSGNRKT
jgi:hypothetical protein